MYCIKADSEDIQKYLESEVLNTADSNLIKKAFVLSVRLR